MQTKEPNPNQNEPSSNSQPVNTSIVQQQSSDASPPEPKPAQEKNLNKWLIASLVSFNLIALGIAGTFTYQNYQLKKQTEKTSSGLKVTPTKPPQPTQASTISAPSPTDNIPEKQPVSKTTKLTTILTTIQAETGHEFSEINQVTFEWFDYETNDMAPIRKSIDGFSIEYVLPEEEIAKLSPSTISGVNYSSELNSLFSQIFQILETNLNFKQASVSADGPTGSVQGFKINDQTKAVCLLEVSHLSHNVSVKCGFDE
jgi:hypothetical protein